MHLFTTKNISILNSIIPSSLCTWRNEGGMNHTCTVHAVTCFYIRIMWNVYDDLDQISSIIEYKCSLCEW